MIIKKKIIIIVDGYSSGSRYASAFIGHGYNCVHVNTNSGQLSTIYSGYNSDLFVENISIHNNDISPVIEKLQIYQVKAVIAGSEIGVYVSDLIAHHFAVARNDINTTLNRRHKFFMIKALSENKVSNMQQFADNSIENILNWYTQSGLIKVILKPVISAGSDGAEMCSSASEIKDAYYKHYAKQNMTGKINTEFVIQECLEGDEYMINSVSCNGKHFITDMWVGVGGIKNTISTDKYADLINRNSNEFKLIETYIYKVLDALDIRNGATHSEVKLTINGPMLIEVGARLTGGLDFAALEECQGYSQLSVSVESILYPELFMQKTSCYAKLPQKHMRFIYLCSEIEGLILKEANLENFLMIPGLESISFIHNVGDYLNLTNKVVGRPGFAFLVTENENTLKDSYLKFREAEKEMYKYILDNT